MRVLLTVPPLLVATCFLAPRGLAAQPLRDARASALGIVEGERPSGPASLAVRPADSGGAASRSTPALVGAGLLGGAAGVLAGGFLGAWLADGDDADDLDFLSGAVAGAAIGEGLGLPLGVRWAAGGEGDPARSALVSLALAGVGLLALEAVHYDAPGAPIVLAAVPVAQLATTIAIERAAGRSREGER